MIELLIGTKSVTVNDLERRNGLVLRYFTEFGSVAFGANCVKWLKIHRYFLRQKCSPKHLVLAI